MKKYAKIFSILLCLSMLVGMIAMIATAEETTEPVIRDPSAPAYNLLPVPQVGYYNEAGELVDVIYHASDDLYGAQRLVDGELPHQKEMVFATNPDFTYDFWQEHEMVFLFEMDEPIILNGLEMYIYLGRYCLQDFKVEVITSEGGEWETVGTYTDAYENPEYATNPDDAKQYFYMFDKTVTAYKLRIVVEDFLGKIEDGVPTKWIVQLYEIAPMIVEVTEPEQPTEPEATEPEVTEPEATEPKPSEPETNGKYTASGNIIETGYAAVGIVDETLCKAEVLLNNGKTGTVYFAGTAPKTGVVYGYELHSNNVFVFIEKAANFGYSDQLNADSAWYMWFTPNGWAWDANSPADVFHAPYPIFLRYGDNQWILTTIDKIAETNGGAAAFGYVLDAVRDMPDYDAGNGLANHHAGALVIDGVKEDQYANPAQLFGAAGEKVGLGSFTTDLYTPTTSGNTGDGPSKTGDVVISVLGCMIAASVIGGAVIISKKKEF